MHGRADRGARPMTLCDNCGSPVTQGDAFCGVCGAYLDWGATQAAPVPVGAPPAPTPEPSVPAAAPPTPDPGPASSPALARPTPVRAAAPPTPVSDAAPSKPVPDAAASGSAPAARALSDAEPEPPAEPAPDPEPTPDPELTPDSEPAQPRGTPGPDGPDTPPVADRANRAAALVVPVPEALLRAAVREVPRTPARVGGPDQPGAVQPGRPVAPRPVLREFSDTDAGGQVACPVCGTQNPAGRSFCRRCGSAMTAAPAPVRSRRRWRIRWPRGRGRLRRLLAILLVVVLLAAAAWAAVRWGPRAVDAVRDRLAKPTLITPARTSASSSARGHGPELVSDGLSNRYWSPAAGRGPGQWVELGFDTPVRVLNLIISGGVSKAQDEYLRHGRPAAVVVSTWTSDDVRTDRRLQLADHAGPQTFTFTAGDTARLRVTITSGYALDRTHPPAIAEIEVFRRP
ncbi:zinc ribbon domain-containing protein [Actinoplanes sp. NBRC 14428]|nr:zinc ribbon domain-containing protein [Actinoplanes sp. NBRC 14428]